MDAIVKLSNEIQRCELLAGDHIYSYRKAWAYLFAHHGIYIGGDKVIHFMGDTLTLSMRSVVGDERKCQSCLKIQSEQRNYYKINGVTADESDGAAAKYGLGGRRSIDVAAATTQGHSPSGTVMISCLSCFLKGGSLRRFRYGVSSLERLGSIRADCCSVLCSDAAHAVLWRAHSSLRYTTFSGTYHLILNNCIHFAFYCKTGRMSYRPAALLINHHYTNSNYIRTKSSDSEELNSDDGEENNNIHCNCNCNAKQDVYRPRWHIFVSSSFNFFITRMVSCFQLDLLCRGSTQVEYY